MQIPVGHYTQLLLPFSREAVGVGSIFIIDPLYTLPLVVGVLAVAWRRKPMAWNTAGLLVSTAYLAWGVLAQQIVTERVRQALAPAGIAADAQLLVTPRPFNTLFWRVVVLEPERSHEARMSVFGGSGVPEFKTVYRRADLLQALQDHRGVARLTEFADGFVRIEEQADGRLLLTDLRMGQEPVHFFRFDIGTMDEAAGPNPPIARKLDYWGDRLKDR